MKAMMILGGLLGFVMGLVLALSQQAEWPSVLWRASIAAYLSGLMMRWWGRMWVKSLKEVSLQRTAEVSNAKTPNSPNKN